VRKFEIYINGDQMSSLLGQVTRASNLFDENIEWLKQPSSIPVKALTPELLIEQDANRLAIHLKHLKGYVPSLALLPASPIIQDAITLSHALG
jgi:hypothetical protein